MDISTAGPDETHVIQAYKVFYEKWHLQGLETLDLPICLQPQLTACSPYNPQAIEGTVNPFLVDTIPIDGEGHVFVV